MCLKKFTSFVLILMFIVLDSLVNAQITSNLVFKDDLREIAQQLKKEKKEKLASKVPLFINGLDSEDKNVRIQAALYLGISCSEKGVDALIDHLIHDSDIEVRSQCAMSLGNIGLEKAVPSLIKALNDPEEKVRITSAISLSMLGEKQQCLEVLSVALYNEDINIRMEVLQGLRNIGSLNAISLLQTALNDADVYVRVDAAILLTELGQNALAFPLLRELINHEDKYIRLATLRGLKNIGSDEAILLVKNALKDKDSEVRERAKYILKDLGISLDQINNLIPYKSEKATLVITYNPQAAANYADTWWNGRNPAYHDYGLYDCANFVSQCLIAGGLDLSAGPGIDPYGCGTIPGCDNLHTNLVNSQGATHERRNRGVVEPSGFLKGDPAIFGNNSDYWTHAVFAVIGDANNYAQCDAHSYNQYHKTIPWFFSVDPNFDVCNYYHITTSGYVGTGNAAVSQGVTITPSTIYVGDNFSVTFTLKETQGSPITFSDVTCAILDANNNFLFDLTHYSNITVPANGTWVYPTASGYRNIAGTYKAVARGKVSNWFDFTTTGSGVNPRTFQVQQTQTITARIDSYSPNDPNNLVEVRVGNSTPISVTFTNTGNTTWSFIAGASVWNVNGNIVGDYSRTISLGVGQQTTVSWAHIVNNSGDYWIQFGIWKDSQTLLDKKPSPSQRLIKGLPQEIVSTPNTPTGPSSGKVGQNLTFNTSGSNSNLGHSVEYQFDWGDGTQSSWGSSSQNHSYSSSGTKNIKARARCQTHTDVVSGWSSTGSISISYCTLTINVSPSGSGSVSKNPDKTDFSYNETIQLTATANSGYSFSGWSGDASGTTNPVTVTMNAPKTITANFTANPSITITTNPTGHQISVDGTTYTAPQTFVWAPNSQHSIGVSSPQSGTTGTQYVYSSWSDGGAQTHTITVPSTNTTYTANFTTQYQLTVSSNPTSGGTTNPSGQSWRNSGENVSISATPNSVYSFTGWSGDASGTTNPVTVTMNAPKTITANFTANPSITITTNPTGRQIAVDGTTYTAPQTFVWAPNSQHSIGVSSPQSGTTGTQYVYSSWSDGGAQTHTITIPSTNTTYTANFTTQYQLTVNASPTAGGTTNPSGTSWRNIGENVSISATPNSVYSFTGWSGDATGTSNPVIVTMNVPKTVTANFELIPETASIPNIPSGPSNGKVGQNLTFNTGGSNSNLGHSVEYQFDWSDGTQSDWGASTQSHSYSSSGIKYVKARVRCQTHTGVVSGWSSTGSVSISYCTLTINVSPAGSGSVTKNPNKTDFTYNETVQLASNANSGYQFSNWGGDLSGSSNTQNLSMNSDKSINIYFTIIPPPVIPANVSVNSPNGGESLVAGKTYPVTWMQQNVANVKIEYSTNNGSSWTTITASTGAAAGSYAWTVPNENSNQCRVRVSDASNATVSNASNAVFSIIPVTVTVVSPNGGERWVAGKTYPVTWTQQNVANLKLEYSSNGGSTWNIITASTSTLSGLYTWTIPDTTSTTCLVKATDASNAAVRDSSNAVFTIARPTVTVVAPNGSEVWTAGSQRTITWTSTDMDSVKVEYSTNGGTVWTVINTGMPASGGSLSWTVPQTASTSCLVRVTNRSGLSVSDLSNAVFTILPVTMMVTSPNGGERWVAGKTYPVCWTQQNVANLKLEYSTNSGISWNLITSSVSASVSSYPWTIPDAASTICLVKATDASNTAVRDSSNAVFTIARPVVTVTAPNGGEVWTAGSQRTITWASSDTDSVKVEYSTNGGTAWTVISTGIPASGGNLAWTVPQTSSMSCLVRVTNRSGLQVSDQSNAVFTIIRYNMNANFAVDSNLRAAGNQGDDSIDSIGGGKLIGFALYAKEWENARGFTVTFSWDSAKAEYRSSLSSTNIPGEEITMNNATFTPVLEQNILTGSLLGAGEENRPGYYTKSFAMTGSSPVGAPNGLVYLAVFRTASTFAVGDSLSIRATVKMADEKGVIKDLGVRFFTIKKSLLPPSNLTVSDVPNDQGHHLRLAWTASESEKEGLVTGYRIYRSRTSVFTDPLPLSRFSVLDSLIFYEQHYTILIDSVSVGKTEYIDSSVPLNGVPYYYWVQTIGKAGASKPVISSTATAVEEVAQTPQEFKLGEIYPNPFNPSATIEYSLPKDVQITLEIYNISGQKVATVDSGRKRAGKHTVVWDAHGLPSGVYFYTLRAEEYVKTGKALLMK